MNSKSLMVMEGYGANEATESARAYEEPNKYSNGQVQRWQLIKWQKLPFRDLDKIFKRNHIISRRIANRQ